MTMRGDIMTKIKTPNGEVRMNMKMPKFYNSEWKRKISLVLVFTMLLSSISPALFVSQSAQAAITYQTPGAIAYSAANGTTVAPAYPAAIAAGDLLVMIIGMKPNVANGGSVTTPSGWTALASLTGAGGFGTTLTADLGNTNVFSFYTIAAGGETGNLTVDVAANNVSWAQMYRYSKTTGEWSVAGATGADTATATAQSIAFSSNPGITTNDQILGAMVIPTDSSTPTQFSGEAFTATGATFAAATEVSEPDTTAGNDMGGFVARTNVTAGPATANPTMTANAVGGTTVNNNTRGPGVLIRIREAAGTAPTAGTVYVTPSLNNYTTSSPTITTAFADAESPVSSCKYTTNGTVWTLGVVSGATPTYTCTATPTALSGALIVNMSAISSGGTTTATQVNVTVDTTAPVDGGMQAVAGNARIGLSWSAATDAGIGLAANNTYKLVKATGASAPANCTGTALYQGSLNGYADFAVTNAQQYSYRVCAYDAAGNVSAGSTVSATPLATINGKLTTCADCHAFPPADGTRSGTTGSVVGDHGKHGPLAPCTTCHVMPSSMSSAGFAHRNGNIQMQAVISGGSYTRGTSFAQTNTLSTTGCSNISCHGGNNPTPQWGVGTATCVDCHKTSAITRTKGVPGGTLDPVMGEFGLAWGHKKTGRGTVTAADCIVCHLEGKYTGAVGTAVLTTTYHADGNIDLRDPDGANETPITNMSGGAFTFQKFSTSYSAGSRTYGGETLNTVDNVLTQKFCLACHDSNGATNTTARSNNGGTGTATMPFGGISTGYAIADGAAAVNGLINVYTQFSTTFSSVHPVRGSLNRDFPTKARLAVPYNGQAGTRVDAGGTKTLSVVMNCFDCHNTPGTPLTTRTIVAHGYTTTPLRGTVYTNSYTLCGVCHTGYTVVDNHGAGSAMASATGRSTEGFNGACYSCHGDSGDIDTPIAVTTVRPRRAQNYHGFNTLVGGGVWPTGGGKPYAFIRNTDSYPNPGYHRPLRGIGELATGSATCSGGAGCAANSGTRTYSPGGQY